jgi:hypothetical protein
MRVRAQTASGDYTFGQGRANFLINSAAAVAQLVLTGLRLLEGEWFLDVTVGTPWLQRVIGKGTKQFYDLAIQNQILSTRGVISIDSYSSSLNAKTRHLTLEASITTQFGPATVSTNLVTPQQAKPFLDFQIQQNSQFLPSLG